MVAAAGEEPRFVVGCAPGAGWIVMDRMSGWISYWHATRGQAEDYRKMCERGAIRPPDPRRN